MEPTYYYGTITEAIEFYRKQGFNLDFNLEENCISCATDKFGSEEFEIVSVYRYEGDTDPADESVVYAIQSNAGHKGILVTGFGKDSDPVSSRILKKLSMHK